MREFRSYGSVRGAVGNNRPYREHLPKAEVYQNAVDWHARCEWSSTQTQSHMY